MFDDYILEFIPLEIFFDLFKTTKSQILKTDVLDYLSIIAFWCNNIFIDEIMSFIFEILNEMSLDHIIICMKVLYYLEYNESNTEEFLLKRINDQINIDFNLMLQDLAFNKLCEFPMKLLRDIARIRKVNDLVDIDIIINCFLNNDKYNDEDSEFECTSYAFDLIISIGEFCEEPFNHDQLDFLITKSYELLTDANSKRKIKGARIISSLFRHFSIDEIERIIQIDVLNQISTVLLVCNQDELVVVLIWIINLFSYYESNPELLKYVTETIRESDFIETLDEVINNAEDEKDNEAYNNAIKIKNNH